MNKKDNFSMSFMVDPDFQRKVTELNEIKNTLISDLRRLAGNNELQPQDGTVADYKELGKAYGIDFRTLKGFITDEKRPRWDVIDAIKKNISLVILDKIPDLTSYIKAISNESVSAFILDYFPKDGELLLDNNKKILEVFQKIKKDNFEVPNSHEKRLIYFDKYDKQVLEKLFEQNQIHIYFGILPFFWYDKLPKEIKDNHLRQNQISCFNVSLKDVGPKGIYKPSWQDFHQKNMSKGFTSFIDKEI